MKTFGVWNGLPTQLGDYPTTLFLDMRITYPQGEAGFDCTGVLIHPRVILTAAHCVAGDGQGTPRVQFVLNGKSKAGVNIFTATNGNNPTHAGLVAVATGARLVPHPQWRYTNNYNITVGYDVGFVVLPEPFGDIAPSKIKLTRNAQEAAALVGRAITIVGFGLQDPNAAFNVGEKTQGHKTVSKATALYFHSRGSEQNGLEGDSGGPIFIEEDGELKVVGILSGGNQAVGPGFEANYATLRPDVMCWVEKTSGFDIDGIDCP